MLALDVATKTGYCYELKNNLYIGTVEGTPVYQYDFLESIPHFNEVAIEELVAFNSPNPKTLVSLAMRVGYLHHRFIENNVMVSLIHPATWRQNLGVKNSKIGTKDLQAKCREKLNIRLNLDETDALGVWLCAMKMQVDDLVSYNIHLLGHNAVNQ